MNALATALADEDWCGLEAPAKGLGRLAVADAADLLVRAWESTVHSYARIALFQGLTGCLSTGLDRFAAEGLDDCEVAVQEMACFKAPFRSGQVRARDDDDWLELYALDPQAVPGTHDLHAPGPFGAAGNPLPARVALQSGSSLDRMGENKYDATNLHVLEFDEVVRARPGMYFGVAQKSAPADPGVVRRRWPRSSSGRQSRPTSHDAGRRGDHDRSRFFGDG
jgi:hypothetical protein